MNLTDKIPTPRFNHLRQYMPEPGRTLLLKDAIFELTGAWKFFTRLSAEQAVFFCLPGFSAMPLSFARHVARVDLYGLAPEEQQLLAETAAAKAISNLRFLQSIAEIQTPYASLIFMPGRENSGLDWQAMMAKLRADGTEEYWSVLSQAKQGKLLQHGKQILYRFLKPQREIADRTLRFCFMATPAPVAHAAKFLPAIANTERMSLLLSPHYSAPRTISVAGEASGANAQGHAEHVIYGVRPAQQASYLARLVLHLNRTSKRVWQPAGNLHVLPGGKVQIALQHQGDARTEAALLKLPLIPHAGTRMRENAMNLSRLAAAQELLPEQRQVFPRNLADGQYEAQTYYLETFLPGRTHAHAADASRQVTQWQAIFELWFDVQQRLARRVKLNEKVIADLLGDVASRLQTWLALAPREAARLQRLAEYCHYILSGSERALSLVHGDFSLKNILIDPATQQVTGVIDWDLADFFSAPLLDVLHFFVRLDERSFRDPSPAIALRLTQTEGAHTRYFDEAAMRFGYHREDWPALVILYWLFRQRGYIGSDKNMDTKFVQRQFLSILDLFEREMPALPHGVSA